jgi:hypothetical protein
MAKRGIEVIGDAAANPCANLAPHNFLSSAQVEFYHENGYLTVEHVYDVATTRELQAVTDHFIELSREVAPSVASEHSQLFDLEPTHTAAIPLPRRLNGPLGCHEVYRRCLHHETMLNYVGQLLGPSGIRLHRAAPSST